MRPSKIAAKVEQLLREYPYLRDSDNRLVANIWHQELTEKKQPTKFFLQMYAEGQLTNAESIRRSRQKLQEHNPELRGKSYKGRRKEQEVVKEDLQSVIFYKK